MSAPLDLNKELANLIYEGNAAAAPMSSSALPTGTDSDLSVKATNLQSTYEKAYPDLLFNVAVAGNDLRITSSPRERANVPSAAAIPAGYSPKLTAAGIEDLQTALAEATTDKDKLQFALQLKTLVATQKSANYLQYKGRAEAEFGVPDLINAIDNIRRAEMTSSNNPGNGMPSRERLELLQSLGVARTHAANRIKEFSDNDVPLAAAENLADATLTQLRVGSAMDEREDRMTLREEKRIARGVAISTIPTDFLEGISILRFNQAKAEPAQLQNIAASLVDGKLKLTEHEKVLAAAGPESLRSLYVGGKDAKEKEQTLRMIQAREEQVTTPEQAKINVQLFKSVFEKPLDSIKDMPELSKRYKTRILEVGASGASSKEKDEMMKASKAGFQNEYLGEVVKRAFYSDVTAWNGIIQSDETAKAVMSAHRNDKTPLTMPRFVDEYVNYNDGRDRAGKSAAMQSIIVSAVEAFPRSVVLPMMSPESALLQAQAIVSAQTMKDYAKDAAYTNPQIFGAIGLPYRMMTK